MSANVVEDFIAGRELGVSWEVVEGLDYTVRGQLRELVAGRWTTSRVRTRCLQAELP